MAVMLAQKWSPKADPTGWWASEKYDGVRAYWNGRQLLTRNDNVIHAPAWFLRQLPKGKHLDGELFIARKKFDITSGIVRRTTPVDADWKKIKYVVFDAPSVSGNFETRQRALAGLTGGVVQLAKQTKVKSQAHLEQLFRSLVTAGAEGVMLRAAGSAYERKRSTHLRKVKVMALGRKAEAAKPSRGRKQKLLGEDHEEAKILAHVPGKGKHEGRLGAYRAKLLKTGAVFQVGTGLTDAHRKKPLRVGSIIVVGFQELTARGTPRFPKYIGQRAD